MLDVLDLIVRAARTSSRAVVAGDCRRGVRARFARRRRHVFDARAPSCDAGPRFERHARLRASFSAANARAAFPSCRPSRHHVALRECEPP